MPGGLKAYMQQYAAGLCAGFLGACNKTGTEYLQRVAKI